MAEVRRTNSRGEARCPHNVTVYIVNNTPGMCTPEGMSSRFATYGHLGCIDGCVVRFRLLLLVVACRYTVWDHTFARNNNAFSIVCTLARENIWTHTFCTGFVRFFSVLLRAERFEILSTPWWEMLWYVLFFIFVYFSQNWIFSTEN